MWDRKEMKLEARASLKRNYWIAVLVCALMAFIFVEYGTSFTIIKTYNEAYKEVQQKAAPAASRDGRDEATSALDGIMEKIGLKFGDQSADEDALEVTSNKGNLSGIVKMIQEKKGIETAVYDFISRIKNHDGLKMIMIGFFSLVLNIIFIIFITNMMIVGERRFFLENMNHPGTLFTRVFYLFSEKKVKALCSRCS